MANEFIHFTARDAMKAILNTAYCSYICTVQLLQLIEKLWKSNTEFCPGLVYLFIPAEKVTAGEKQRMHLMQASSKGWREEQRWGWGQLKAWERWQNKTRKRTCRYQVFPYLIKLSNKMSHPSSKLQITVFLQLFYFCPFHPMSFAEGMRSVSSHLSPWEASSHLQTLLAAHTM